MPQSIVVILEFIWPQIQSSAEGLKFYSAIVDSSIIYLLSNVDIWEFGYGYLNIIIGMINTEK